MKLSNIKLKYPRILKYLYYSYNSNISYFLLERKQNEKKKAKYVNNCVFNESWRIDHHSVTTISQNPISLCWKYLPFSGSIFGWLLNFFKKYLTTIKKQAFIFLGTPMNEKEESKWLFFKQKLRAEYFKGRKSDESGMKVRWKLEKWNKQSLQKMSALPI